MEEPHRVKSNVMLTNRLNAMNPFNVLLTLTFNTTLLENYEII